jgi:hypothetical protein
LWGRISCGALKSATDQRDLSPVKNQNCSAANEYYDGKSEQFASVIHGRQSNSQFSQVAKDRTADYTK